MHEIKKNPWERLKQERNRLGLSQEELAKFGGVTKRSQVNYENGRRKPKADYFKGIADAGADVEYIISGTPKGVYSKLDAIKKATAIVEPLQLPDDIAADLHQLLFFVEIKDREGIIKALTQAEPVATQSFPNVGSIGTQVTGNIQGGTFDNRVKNQGDES